MSMLFEFEKGQSETNGYAIQLRHVAQRGEGKELM